MIRLRHHLWKLKTHASGNVLRNLDALKRYERLSADAVRDLQARRLEEMLLYASNNVPYYSRILSEHGVVTKDRIDLSRFESIPPLTKNIIREQGGHLYSRQFREEELISNTSGGSTGEPVRFVQDRTYWEWNHAVKLLFNEWAGHFPCDRLMLLWGSERDLLVGRETLRTYFGRWLRNEVWMNSFRLDRARLDRYLRRINEFKPNLLLAYVESAYQLAVHADRTGVALWSPRAVMTTAGTLHPDVRKRIEQAFGCPVYDSYGSREVGSIACESDAHEGLQISAPTHFVELLDDGGQRVEGKGVGEVVVTSLTNRAMPLIRYRIGDLASWAVDEPESRCAWPRLAKVVGRVTDSFVCENGDRVHGEYFSHLLYFRPWIEKFRFTQEAYKKVRLDIVPAPGIEHLDSNSYRDEIEEITGKVRLVMGSDCEVPVKLVRELQPAPSGKYRYTVSEVKTPDSNRVSA